jgi:hypothetical protein
VRPGVAMHVPPTEYDPGAGHVGVCRSAAKSPEPIIGPTT